MRTQTSKTSASHLFHFQDARPPQEILAAVEHDIVKVFSTSTKDGKLIYTTQTKITGAPYQFEIRYEAALPKKNAYSLRVDSSWGDTAATHHEYFSNSLDSWMKFWTRNFKRSEPVDADAGSAERYAKIRDEALQAEARLDSVPTIQQIIVEGMKRGAWFSTAHKEGGTVLKWEGGQFLRSDYGDDPDLKKFANETEFLKALRQFYDWETSSALYPNKAPELDAWKLILRKMSTK